MINLILIYLFKKLFYKHKTIIIIFNLFKANFKKNLYHHHLKYLLFMKNFQKNSYHHQLKYFFNLVNLIILKKYDSYLTNLFIIMLNIPFILIYFNICNVFDH